MDCSSFLTRDVVAWIDYALSSCVIGYPCPIFKFTPILSVVPPVTVVAMKFKGPTFFNCMTVSITMLILFVCGIIRHIV